MALGLSIYPLKATEDEIIEYLELAKQNKYEWIFTSLLAITSESEHAEKLKNIIKHSKQLGYKIQVDVAPKVFEALNIEATDLSYFAELGVDAIRLDEPFNGQVESVMTYNEYGIDIIINASTDNHYLDLILDYQGNKNKIIACHNFYPQSYTGLTREFFQTTSEKFKAKGIHTAAFINSNSGKLCSAYEKDGCPTLEEHRTCEVATQIRDLKYSQLVDDIYFSTMFVSEEDLKIASEIYYNENQITLDIELVTEINETELAIINYDHFYRGDISGYMIRSTMTRIAYKDEQMNENNIQTKLYRGDIVILNDNYENYAKELHIVLQDFTPNNNRYNVIGKVPTEQHCLLNLIKPWGKFKLKIK